MKTTGKGRPDPWTEATAEATVDEALRLMKPTAHVTEEVKAALATELPGVCDSVAAVAHMTPLRLAAKLIGTPGVDEDHLMDIARDLITSFQAMLGEDRPQPAPEPQPKPQPKPEPKAKPRADAPAEPRQADEAKYRQLLLDHAQGHKSSMSGDLRLGRTVVRSFKTMSGSVHFDGTVVLGSSSTMSGDLYGTAYVPYNVSFSTLSGDDNSEVYVKSYAELAKIAGLA